MRIKKVAFKILCLLTVVTLMSTTSCSDSEDFSSDSALKIEFPTTTVFFDTVFAAIASPVQDFYIYNRNKHSISFESIELVNAEKSSFRININGQSGTAFYREELLKKDSLYVMIDVKASSSVEGSEQVEDKIKFVWNGNTEYINLKANVIDVEIWDDKTIDADMKLTANESYYIRGKVHVKEGTVLNIEEGVTLYFDKKGSLLIDGTVQAIGTTEKPIVLRGHRFDFIEAGILYDNAPGQWEGIIIGANSFDNVLKDVRIRNAKNGLSFIESIPEKKKATLLNTIVHNMSEGGVSAVNCNVDMLNCQITNSKDALISLIGGNYSFIHCTIGNYYDWHGRTTASVVLHDSKGGVAMPLETEFTNSIIVGTFYDEVSNYSSKNISNNLFTNCLIQASERKETSDYVNIVWNLKDVFLFKELDSRGNSQYSFELLEDSPARNQANQEISNTIPNDLRGVSRLTDGKSDIGCYEWY